MTQATDTGSRTLLARLIAQQHWTCDDFRRHFESAARSLPDTSALSVSTRQANRWLTGALTSRPYPAACRVLEKMFNYSVDDLLTPDVRRRDVHTPDVEPLSVGPGSMPGVSERAASTWPAGDADLALERQIVMSTRRAREFLPLAEGSNLGPNTVAQIYDELRRLANRDDGHNGIGPAAAFPDLVDLQDLIFRLLEGRQRPEQTRDLYFLCAAASGMVANVIADLGDPIAAIAHSRVAYVCAENAGHEPLKVWIRCVQSVTSYWAGWTMEAARYCRLASEIGPVDGTVAAFLPALDARAQAALGNGDATLSAIRRAAEARESLIPNDLDAIGLDLTFTRPRQMYYVADAYSWLPSHNEPAEQAALDAVTAYEQAAPDERTYIAECIARTDLSLARARSGNPDGATDALRPVLDLPNSLRCVSIRRSVKRVHNALAVPALVSSASARALIAEIEYFTRTAPVPALPI
ncbi:XRE family transcriptional regulator [Frankia sp. Cr2]|uniref:XRE family transcriptional regulator n=1 Tax=Frankia sp. Cr2 TaxID=3073932 RepID=UPI002AD27827|nr:XRE family transcriptional regulator [Frankia sp. Cr2]